MPLISRLQDGEFARVRGRVRQASHQLLYAAGERPCVYWDMRKSINAEPEEHQGQPFWVEDPRGDKVLIYPDQIQILVAGEERRTLLETATADLHAVTARIRQLKDQLREFANVDSDLQGERKRLSKVATLLCAIRAHARGNLHASANLVEQQRFIDEKMHLIQSDGLGTATMTQVVDRLEVVLAPEDSVEVEGVFRMEPMPPDLVGAQGYRERPMCWMVHDGAERPAKLVGVGGIAPARSKPAPNESESPIVEAQSVHSPPHRDPIVQGTVAAVMTLFFYYLFFF